MKEIVFEGGLTALNVPELKTKVQDGLENSPGVTLRFRKMAECDALGVQMLVSAGKTAQALNKPLVLAGDLAPVLDMANRMGLPHEQCFTLEERSA